MNFQCLYDIAEPIHTELEQMRKEKSFTDVCLILNDSRGMERRIYAHRVILASAIPYFKRMFFSGIVESKTENIHIKEVDADTMEIIVIFVYTGKISVDGENFKQLLIASDFFEMNLLVETISTFMSNRLHQIDTSIAIAIKTLYHKYPHIDALKTSIKKAETYIKKNFANMSKSEEFLRINSDLLFNILSWNDLVVESEELVYHFALNWLNFFTNQKEKAEKQTLKDKVISLARFQNLSEDILSNVLHSETIVTGSAKKPRLEVSTKTNNAQLQRVKPLVPRGAYYVLLDTTDNSGKLEFPKSVPKHSYLCIWPEETRYNQIGKKEPTQFFCDSKQQALKTPLACRVRLTNKIIDGQIVSYISMYGRYLQDAKSNRHLTIGQENSEHNRKLHFTKFANEQNKFELLPLLRRQHNDSEGISAVMRSEDGKYIRLATGGCLIADANNFTQAVHLIFKPSSPTFIAPVNTKMFIRTKFGYLEIDRNNKLRIDTTVPMKPKHEFIVHYNADLTCLSLYSPLVDRFMNCGTFSRKYELNKGAFIFEQPTFSDSSSLNKGAFIFDAPTTGKDETEFEVQFNESARNVTLYYAKHHSYSRSKEPILVQTAVANSSNRLNFISLDVDDDDEREPLELFFESVSIK